MVSPLKDTRCSGNRLMIAALLLGDCMYHIIMLLQRHRPLIHMMYVFTPLVRSSRAPPVQEKSVQRSTGKLKGWNGFLLNYTRHFS